MINDSNWKAIFEPIVLTILSSDEFSLKKDHHFGRPFVTAYQLAVAIERKNPELCHEKNMVIGDKTGNGKMNLAQYLARWLSEEIKKNSDYMIEGAWLSANFTPYLSYEYQQDIKSGMPNEDYGGKVYSLFRWKA